MTIISLRYKVHLFVIILGPEFIVLILKPVAGLRSVIKLVSFFGRITDPYTVEEPPSRVSQGYDAE